jgi:hypothetical protein
MMDIEAKFPQTDWNELDTFDRDTDPVSFLESLLLQNT